MAGLGRRGKDGASMMQAAAAAPAALLFVLSSASSAAGARPSEKVIAPGDNLVVQGIPPIPARLADEVGRYGEFRTAGFLSWHPLRREMLVVTRFANTYQIHRVSMPGGARTQLTFFPDNVF